MSRALRERIQGAIGLGAMMSFLTIFVYHCCGVPMPESALFGFFLCAALPTFAFTGEP